MTTVTTGKRVWRSSRQASWVALGLALCAGCGDGAGEATAPHVVLITSDTLRADHLSVSGYPRETSPNLDAFAARTHHFTDAVTVIPETGPSFATIFTGRHPQQHGMHSNFEGVPLSIPMLAERLKERGYRTAGFVGNPVLRESKGFDRGFEHYEMGQAVNESFLRWAEQPWDQPTFVWLHYMEPHGPYKPPEELERIFIDDAWSRSDERVAFLTEEQGRETVLGAIPAYQRQGDEDRVAVYVARYDAEIRYMDTQFGEIIEFLERQGLHDGSAIVFTSDHGESLGEHEFYFEHGWFVFEPSLHVPLMIKRPGQREGSRHPRQVSNLDLLPTLLALAGAAVDGTLPGVDLLGDALSSAEVLLESSERYPEKYYGVRGGGWKYVFHPRSGVEELYDLREDPAESLNLAREMRLDSARLRMALGQLLEEFHAATAESVRGTEDKPEVLERLRALGYTE
jgi:arylsulfatase A-like enzyme